ncbi:hypothetical protein BGX26_000013 [Mortierella sp. AD094]|nr:hypothetical protein BGX26_000013 [Mortierella sp. AD094]
MESSALRMNKRLRQLAKDENVETSDKSDIQEHTEAPERLAVKDNPHKNEAQPKRPFSRPKPPGKNRVALIQHSSLPTKSRKSPPQGQESRVTGKNTSNLPAEGQFEPETGLVSASLESRMNHVRDWLKERKPPMISPPLSARSDDMRESRMPYKRKAYRQLAPATGPKRLAMEERQDRQIGDDDSRIYPQLSDTVASAPQTQTRPLSSRSNALLSPRYNQLGNSRYIPKGLDPSRDQPESDPFLPPINWGKFQRPAKAVVRPSSSLSATAATATAVPSSSFTFRRTPTKSNSFISRALSAEDDDNPTVSPLIKLRQSQLKQRQQEDYLGIKRDESFVAAARRAEAEGALAFNQALETWEREDDEELARNAAREAAEAEARGQRLGHSQIGSSPSLDSDPEEKNRRTSSSYLEREYTMSAPAPSLLRAVPFNGESSRRPVPDLQPKKSPNDAKTQYRATSDLEKTSATASATTSRLPSLLDQRPLSSKTFSASFDSGNNPRPIANTRGSASLTKSNSYPNTRKEEEDAIGRRQRHPGLYTPSKKKPTSDGIFATSQELQSQSPRTPTAMSRYIQLSNLSDEELYD